MINQQYTNLLYTIKKLVGVDLLKINTLYKNGFFDKDPNCKYDNYRHRFYNQILKDDASGIIDPDVYRHCLEAVQQDGNILMYINNQKETVCKSALFQNKEVVQYVKIKLNKSL